jgi:hypothetical protein
MLVLLGLPLSAEQDFPYAEMPPRAEPGSAKIRSMLYGGFGYEDRGVVGQAETLYAGAGTGTELVMLRTALSCDARSVQFGMEKYFDFRSWMLEAGTGRTLLKPFGFRFRYQIERFSRFDATLQSVIPFITFDSRCFFCTLGYNFRTLSLYDGNTSKPYFSIEERELACAAGIKIPLSKWLSGSFALRNYDDYAAGNLAALGWEGSLGFLGSGYKIRATAGWRPSGATALAATPSGAVLRVYAEMTL